MVLLSIEIMYHNMDTKARGKTRGKNSPFKGRKLFGKVLMTLHGGRVVFSG